MPIPQSCFCLPLRCGPVASHESSHDYSSQVVLKRNEQDIYWNLEAVLERRSRSIGKVREWESGKSFRQSVFHALLSVIFVTNSFAILTESKANFVRTATESPA